MAWLAPSATYMRDGVEDVTQGLAEVMFSNEGMVMSHADYIGALSPVAAPPSFLDKIMKRLAR